uniref:Uncharacterized protein n=1 Tax=Arundo donax TaxID=35708 RepID=A0A0A9HPG1_ARUDO
MAERFWRRQIRARGEWNLEASEEEGVGELKSASLSCQRVLGRELARLRCQ